MLQNHWANLTHGFAIPIIVKIIASAIISDPDMIIDFVGGEITINQNGDQLANFYYCDCCGDLLAVGCNLNSQLLALLIPIYFAMSINLVNQLKFNHGY